MAAAKRTFEVHEILQEVRIGAPPERVWNALVRETSSWWHSEFYVGGEPRSFHIEAWIGGRMWEDGGGGQGLLWGTVIGVRTAEFLQVSGVLDAPFGGPASLLTTWRLEARDGGTVLRFQQTTWGAAGAGTNASLDAGWRFLFERCLKEWVEAGRRVTDPAPTC
ncbi:MAG: SRPBCC domain-containing protein [Planctomycetota bacterium]|nr:SRPBCC domain-containing protein [Planctomycetota bacterium]